MGWGIAVMPEQMAAPGLAAGRLLAVHADVFVDVLLHWHQWKLLADAGDDKPAPPGIATALPWSGAPAAAGQPGSAADQVPLRAGVLDRIGRALAEGARAALRPPG